MLCSWLFSDAVIQKTFNNSVSSEMFLMVGVIFCFTFQQLLGNVLYCGHSTYAALEDATRHICGQRLNDSGGFAEELPLSKNTVRGNSYEMQYIQSIFTC